MTDVKRVNVSKADLLAKSKVKTRDVTFPKSGVTLTIRDPRYIRRQEMLAAYGERLESKDGAPVDAKAVIAHDVARGLDFQRSIVLECVIDADTGQPMFDEADWSELLEGDGVLISEVFAEVMGSINAEKVKAAGNDSAPTLSDASSSA